MAVRRIAMSEAGKVAHVGGLATAIGSAAVAAVTSPDSGTSDKAVAIGVGGLLVALSPTLLAVVNQLGTAINAAIVGWFADRKDARAERREELQRDFQRQLDAAKAEAEQARRDAADARRQMMDLQVQVRANATEIAAGAGQTAALLEKIQENGFLPLPPHLAMESGANWPYMLIVEDHAETARALNKTMAGHGYRVTPAATTAKAIEAIRAKVPEIVLLDLKLADGDGLPVLRYIRDQGLPSKVIVTTGATDPDRLAAAWSLHPDDVQEKPIDIDKLLAAIRKGSSTEIPTVPPPGESPVVLEPDD